MDPVCHLKCGVCQVDEVDFALKATRVDSFIEECFGSLWREELRLNQRGFDLIPGGPR